MAQPAPSRQEMLPAASSWHSVQIHCRQRQLLHPPALRTNTPPDIIPRSSAPAFFRGSLGREAGLSRSAVVDCFVKLIGHAADALPCELPNRSCWVKIPSASASLARVAEMVS